MNEYTRSQVVDHLREALLRSCDDEHSLCLVAAEKGLFCRGFSQWKLFELKRLYPQITRSRPHPTRKEMEELANRWQLARQTVKNEPISCDVQVAEDRFRSCMGWDEFSDEELARFHAEICGEEVRILAQDQSST
jgi:hypothetical protein